MLISGGMSWLMVEQVSLSSPLRVVFSLNREFQLSRSCQGQFGSVLSYCLCHESAK